MELTQEIVRRLLDYDPTSGVLTWRYRGSEWINKGHKDQRSLNIFNSKFAKKQAFTCDDKYGYKVGSIFGKQFFSHRIIWLWVNGYFPVSIDHVNRICSDNRLSNLRESNPLENMRNLSLSKRNKSGYTGVTFSKSRQLFLAYYAKNYKRTYIGNGFETAKEAYEALIDERNKAGFNPEHGSEKIDAV